MHVLVGPVAHQLAYLTKVEVERLFAVIPHTDGRNRLLFEVMYRYGLRRREAAIIRREHVGERIWITRIKGGVPLYDTPRTSLGNRTFSLEDLLRVCAECPLQTVRALRVFMEEDNSPT